MAKSLLIATEREGLLGHIKESGNSSGWTAFLKSGVGFVCNGVWMAHIPHGNAPHKINAFFLSDPPAYLAAKTRRIAH